MERLASDRAGFPPSHGRPVEQLVPKTSTGGGPIVAEILDKYLDWCKKHRTGRRRRGLSRPVMFSWITKASSSQGGSQGQKSPSCHPAAQPGAGDHPTPATPPAGSQTFLNADGRPSKRFAIAKCFDRLDLALGISALKEQDIPIPSLPRFNRRAYTDKAALAVGHKGHKQKLRERRKQILKLARQHGRKFALYDARHGFAHRLSKSGANHLAVAELMGHSTCRMVAETYAHVNRVTFHLKEALKKASGEDVEASPLLGQAAPLAQPSLLGPCAIGGIP